eukprot:4318006-Pleurochrysis_carterae.AAC.1
MADILGSHDGDRCLLKDPFNGATQTFCCACRLLWRCTQPPAARQQRLRCDRVAAARKSTAATADRAQRSSAAAGEPRPRIVRQ